jgi:hypothetical protein
MVIMSNDKRVKKRYRPRPVDHNPLARLTHADPALVRRTLASFESALLSMQSGSVPTVDDWRLMADCVNTVETLTFGDSPKLLEAEVRSTLEAATAGMRRAGERFKDGKSMRLDASGLEALRDCIAIYRQCAEGLTAREMIDAQNETARRVAELLALNDPSRMIL